MARGADAGIEFGLTSCGLERGGRVRIGLAPCGFSSLQAPTIGQGLPSLGVLVLVSPCGALAVLSFKLVGFRLRGFEFEKVLFAALAIGRRGLLVLAVDCLPPA